jgi:hypothetical protein
LCTFNRIDELKEESRSRPSPFDIQETLATCEGLITQIITEKEMGTQTTPGSKRKHKCTDRDHPNKKERIQEEDTVKVL